MPVTIPDEFVKATQWSPKQFKCEIAVRLFKEEKLTLGQACKLAGLHRLDFQSLLASRKIPVHYSDQELDMDMATLGKWNTRT